MIKADLITGFLGSGKTTFIKKYVRYLLNKGERICIIENDFGAINIDMMLLQELKELGVGLEMIAGGCDRDCHIRRFKTKLLTVSMLGYDRVIIEPSGLFDVDEYFDIVNEDDIYERVKTANVITLVDATTDELDDVSEFIFASQIAVSGKIIITHTDCIKDFNLNKTKVFINSSLKNINCKRILKDEDFIVLDNTSLIDDDVFKMIESSSYKEYSYTKKYSIDNTSAESLFFMESSLSLNDLKNTIVKLMNDKRCGNIMRIKGFVAEDNKWYEVNYNKRSSVINEVKEGQNVIIVIGENLDADYIDSFIPSINSSGSVIRNIKEL